MEALRAEPVAEGETPVSSVQVVSKVLSQNSSHHFLKNVGIKPVASSRSSSSNESELREQLAAEKQASAAVQGELNDLKRRSEEAEEKLARTQKDLEEYKKLTEINNKAVEENNALLKRILSLGIASSSTWALLVAAVVFGLVNLCTQLIKLLVVYTFYYVIFDGYVNWDET